MGHIPKTQPSISKEVLEDLYINKKLSGKEISKLIGYSDSSVWGFLHYYGITLRPKNQWRGRSHSDETKRKIKEKRKLQSFDARSRAKMSIAQKKRIRTSQPRTGPNGYIWVLAHGHPNAYKNGYIALHRLLMSQKIGRPLEKSEIVHHKNGNKLDNRVKNLELLIRVKHNGRHKTIAECPKCHFGFGLLWGC